MGLKDLPLVEGLCLAQRTSTTMGLKDLPLIGGLCLVQRTSTTMGLKDLPFVGGLCLAQKTLAKWPAMTYNGPQQQMTRSVDGDRRKAKD